METTEQDRSANAKCANPDCRVSVDGRCIEGFKEPAACPQFGKALAEAELIQENLEPLEANFVPLPGSIALEIPQAQNLLREKLTNTIAIVGPHDAGKTSLISGFYDLFQRGPVLDIAFASSSTLHSFEQACHDSRSASRRDLPHMERTLRGQVRFYHLDLAGREGRLRLGLLLADRAGEEYFETRSDPDSARDFPELARADTITVLADGAKLLDSGLRHNVKSEVLLTLQAFLDADIIRPWQRLAIVLTKLDAVRSGPEAGAKALKDFDGLVAAVRSAFDPHFAEIQSFYVAANPQSDAAERGEGLDLLIKYWVKAPCRYKPLSVGEVEVRPTRAFGRLEQALKTEQPQ